MTGAPESADQKRTRRRWINLAELVAVAGVLIAALTLWSNWQDRRADEAEKRVEQSSEARDKARLDLKASIRGGDVTLADEKHEIRDATIRFPSALGIAALSPAGEIAIPSDTVAEPMLKLTDGGADDRTGRLPVLVDVRYWDGVTAKQAVLIYDLTWRTKGRTLRGRSFAFEGARLRERGGTQRALDAAWAQLKP